MRLTTLLLLLSLVLPFHPLRLEAGESAETVLNGLPEKIADCERASAVRDYGKPELGASVAYGSQDGLVFTVYLYNLGHENIGEKLDDPVLKEAFDSAQGEIKGATEQGVYKDVEKRDAGKIKVGAGKDAQEVLRARYRLTFNMGARTGEKMISELYIFGAQGQIGKVRVTGGRDKEAAHAKVIEQFVPKVIELLRKPPQKPAKKPGMEL